MEGDEAQMEEGTEREQGSAFTVMVAQNLALVTKGCSIGYSIHGKS